MPANTARWDGLPGAVGGQRAAHGPSARRVSGFRRSRNVTRVIVGFVNETISSVDLAWEQFASARAAGDQQAVARAGIRLASALAADGRLDEAEYLYGEAALTVRECDDRPALAEAGNALNALKRRNAAATDIPSQGFLTLWELAAVGFVAVKTLGPFLEAFATKLGEPLGESCAQALRRIRLYRLSWGMTKRSTGGVEKKVDVKLPAGSVTLELPDPFTDEAKLAFIDLDVSEVAGKTLGWDAASGKWTPRQDG
jgi:hypothetical protein